MAPAFVTGAVATSPPPASAALGRATGLGAAAVRRLLTVFHGG
ncbi:hypothetical protein AB0K64_03165 [Streptomyces sp. NPDC053741]|uniref:Uncharacterized protein n=1 Tax=[Kitasatospora] papulosa TaxID=1464011 RepID=A0ABZ1K7P6_9ACTN|nr:MULTISPECIES: hypothetical protein [Streptomyces]MDX2618664.1 hypothetical protein [Streptomyces sp. WI03-5b]MDX3184173.1 hypothetical protein [Streptomyces sp. ME02-7008A-1]MCY1652556.1 hypothetical protein [Streptomyces sp. SL203]MCY1680233.1 hypothetical protein [Streptomyces sp. SL294]MDX3304448.1 hypothetical protein [Streptomyces sp. ME02-7008A]